MSDLWRYRLGLALVTVSAIFWSTSGYFTRLIDLDLATVLFWRGMFGGLGIFVFIAVYDRRNLLAAFPAMGWPGWSYAGVSAVAMLCFIAALKTTTIAHVAIIYAVAPFVAAGLAWLAMRERPSRSAVAASAVALVGTCVMVGLGGDGSLLGDFLALAMTVLMAALMVLARRYRTIPTLHAAGLSSLLSVIAVWPFAAPLGASGADMINLAGFGIVNSALGLALFTLGSKYLPAIETALIGALDAPLAPLWVWLAFAETPTTATLAGGFVVFCAVVFHVISSFRPRTVRQALP